MTGCEWDPDGDVPALAGRDSHAEATLSVGVRPFNWHLCETCAKMPRFDGLKVRELRKASP